MVKKSSFPQIIFLGGLEQIGRNATALRYEQDLLLIDTGLQFPEPDMLGVEKVIPNFKYIYEYAADLRGIVFTHAHEDHIGAAPFLLERLPETNIYGSRLTLALLRHKLKKHGVVRKHRFHEIKPKKPFGVGRFRVELVQVAHSVPDNMAVYIKTPKGNILHSSDFKIDHTPVDKMPTDLIRLAEIGDEGVDVLLSDSTNATEPGMTISETVVGETINQVVGAAPGRVIMASFASNIHRIQQMFWAAERWGRRVAVLGRSMTDTIEIARSLQYLHFQAHTLLRPADIQKTSPSKVMMICTGSQGEPQAALARMAQADYQGFQISDGDTVLISADPIPGNERLVQRTVDACLRRGAKVVNELENVHVSGHGCAEEQKMLIMLTRPQYFIPIHGEYRMLTAHRQTALTLGIPLERVHIAANGDVLELQKQGLRKVGEISAEPQLVDGGSLAYFSDRVFVDRKNMSLNGVLTFSAIVDLERHVFVTEPVILSRGCFYQQELERHRDEISQQLRRSLEKSKQKDIRELNPLRRQLQDDLYFYISDRLKRKPIILGVLHAAPGFMKHEG